MAGTKESDGLYLMALFWALKNERSPIGISGSSA